MFNPNYDSQFFIAQFIRGLKIELQGAVEAHIPDTLEKAMLIARVHQELLDDAPTKPQRAYGRAEIIGHKPETAKPTLKFATGELWKDRQLRDYRRLNNLCFKCGDKYDPTHVCGQKQAATLNVMEDGECTILLSEEVLNLIEMNDVAEAQQLSLSIHAMDGSEGAETLRLRAMVGNQVFIILVDSGSSSSFIHPHVLSKIQCTVTEVPSMAVKVANGEFMHTSKLVPEFTWWSQGATFVTPMRVLDLGAYDAILGIDWLKKYSPMTTDWAKKSLSFPHNGTQVTLQGLQNSPVTSVREVSVEQLAKWTKGNDIWAMAIVQCDRADHLTDHQQYPAEI
jgi:hypothetical protein